MQRLKTAILKPGKARYASTNRGLALLDEAIEQIELQAQADVGQWYQPEYRCNSGMCLAGWADQLAGGRWLASAASMDADMLAIEPDDPKDHYEGLLESDGQGVGAEARAMRLLELGENEADTPLGWLFNGDNDLARIKAIRNWLAENVYAKRS